MSPLIYNNDRERLPSALFHSCLSASIGSIREAWRAGRYAARVAAAIMTSVAVAIVSGSLGLRPYSIVEINRVRPQAAARPGSVPTATSTSDSRSTIHSTSPLPALLLPDANNAAAMDGFDACGLWLGVTCIRHESTASQISRMLVNYSVLSWISRGLWCRAIK